MGITVNHSVVANLTYNAKFSELVELVDAAMKAGLNGNAQVSFKHGGGSDQRDPMYTEITVSQR